MAKMKRFWLWPTTTEHQPYSGWVFLGLLTDEGGKKALFPKICHTHSTMMKPGILTPYLKEIQKL